MQKQQHDNVSDLLDLLFEYDEIVKQEHLELYRNDPQLYLDKADEALSDITNGALLGLLVSSVFTGISGGWVLGLVAFGVGLAQILLSPQPESPRQPDAVFQPKYGSESLGGFARNGQIIPAIFTSAKADPTGGFVTGGDLIYSLIETKDGNQYNYGRFAISLGVIKNVDISRTTINEQPLSRYSALDFKFSWCAGTDDQKPLPEYSFWSQNLPVTVSNGCGAGKISKSVNSGTNRIGVTNIQNFTKTYSGILGIQITRWYRLNTNPEKFFTIATVDEANSTITINQDLAGFIQVGQTIQFSTPSGGVAGEIVSLPTTSASYFNVPAEEFESYNNANQYLGIIEGSNAENAQYYKFRLLEKNKTVINNIAYYGLVIDTIIPKGNLSIYSYNTIQYQTTKLINRLDLNFVAQVWGRNNKGELIDFACIYTLWIKKFNENDFTCVLYFYIRSSNPSNLYRSLKIDDLALNSYVIEIRSEIIYSKSSFTNIPCLELTDQGNDISVTTVYGKITTQGNLNQNSVALLSGISNQDKDRVPDNSNQRGFTLTLQHVNEIQKYDRKGDLVDCSYKGISTVQVYARSSNLISRSPNFAFFVDEGIIVKKLIYSDTNYSDNNYLFFNTKNTLTYSDNLFITNLENNKSSKITKIENGTISTIDNINWEYGDECLVYSYDSSCWWTEIYNALASDQKFGVAHIVNANLYINYKKLIENTKWLKGDNEHSTYFAWHGAITATGKLNAINNENAEKVMLSPCRSDGRLSFFPKMTPNIVALFNESNISDIKLERISKYKNVFNTVVLTYLEQEYNQFDKNSLKFKKRDITTQTLDVYYGNKEEITTTINIDTCTSYKQAKKSSQILLNLARYSGRRSISFKTNSIEAIGLTVGSLIDVRTDDINNISEYTGNVIGTGNNSILLNIDLILVNSKTITTLENKLIDQSIDFIQAGVKVNDVVKFHNYDGFVELLTITKVSKHILNVSGNIKTNCDYVVLDNTFNDLVGKFISYDGTYKNQTLICNINQEGEQWLSFAGEQPNIGNIVSIGYRTEVKNIYQCVSVTPTIGEIDEFGKAEISVDISAINWDDRLFKYDDVAVVSRNGTDLLN